MADLRTHMDFPSAEFNFQLTKEEFESLMNAAGVLEDLVKRGQISNDQMLIGIAGDNLRFTMEKRARATKAFNDILSRVDLDSFEAENGINFGIHNFTVEIINE